LKDNLTVKRAYLIALYPLLSALSYAQSSVGGNPQFDLTRIGEAHDGNYVCQDVGRLQDWPSEVMDQIIAAGPKAVPILIAMISDARLAKREPVYCYWPGMAIGDIAFCLLSDLFTDANGSAIGGTPTIPGAGWNEILGPPGDLPAWEQLHQYIRKHGRAALQAKWQSLWRKYRDQIVWDAQKSCFKLRSGQ
jgi:hypothetical protein